MTYKIDWILFEKSEADKWWNSILHEGQSVASQNVTTTSTGYKTYSDARAALEVKPW